MKPLLPWAATLSILTSLVIIEGTWAVRCYYEWPGATIRPTERHQATPPPFVAPTAYPTPPPSTPRKAGAVEFDFGEPPLHNWEARLAAWEKTAEGIKEMRMWRKRR